MTGYVLQAVQYGFDNKLTTEVPFPRFSPASQNQKRMVIHGLLDSHGACSAWAVRLLNRSMCYYLGAQAAFAYHSCADNSATRHRRADLPSDTRRRLRADN